MDRTDCELTLDEQQLRRFGAVLAAALQGRETLLLRGDLGSGKTTCARSVIQALCGAKTEVASPTFLLLQEYDAPAGFLIRHFDLYRLKKQEELLEIGLEEGIGRSLTVIEWPEIALPVLPAARLEIAFSNAGGKGEARRLQLTATGAMVALLYAVMQQWSKAKDEQ